MSEKPNILKKKDTTIDKKSPVTINKKIKEEIVVPVCKTNIVFVDDT